MNEYEIPLADTNLDKLLLPDVMYLVVENETYEKLFIFGIAGKTKVTENSLFDSVKSVTLTGGPWVSIMPYGQNTGIYIENEANVLAMLDIIKKNEAMGIEKIRKKIERFCQKNVIYNYCFVNIMN